MYLYTIKNTIMKKFENVKVNDTVSFHNKDGKIETGRVTVVSVKTFRVCLFKCWDNNGVKSFYDAYFTFFKTGIKANHRYNYGNAIEITGTV